MTATVMLLAAFAASAETITPVSWETDYAKACTRAVEQNRPIAVFIGDGSRDAVTEGSRKVLARDYVCVFVDRSTDAGKSLAESFEMEQGLVISDRGGAKQALRLAGAISADDLATSLARFAKPDLVVTTTSTSPNAVQIAPIQPYCPNGNCPFAR